MHVLADGSQRQGRQPRRRNASTNSNMVIWGRPVDHQASPHPLSRRGANAEDSQREYLWNTPDGDKPDFAEAYTYGDEILISWNALNNSIYDLWLTSWQVGPDPVVLCLASKSETKPNPPTSLFQGADLLTTADKGAVNLTQDGSLKLVTSDPPAAEFARETKYVFRFKPPTSQGEFVASDPDLSSPGFLLVEPSFHQNNFVPSTTGTTQSPSATPAPIPTQFPATPSLDVATPPAGSEDTKPNMSPIAAAGLTIGLILAVVLLVAVEVGYLMWRRRRRRRRGHGDESDEKTPAPARRRWWKRRSKDESDRGLFIQVGKAERIVDDKVWMSPELPGDSTWGQSVLHELQGSRLGRGNPPKRSLTINSSVVELEAGRGVSEPRV
ncbi:hypothetical protein MYCTH_2305806 [Thermothelomyces thermophilus ATCC 42464]|uniref:Uncharacterized protein n=1 Tax=Thermothelomyces thermophilus (strain ATCC 42464 / BCRC 31852 / DSM 1799) TaxID=573729 RepID=G2QFT9_THET4|nr:uncharacterized protein MYCTH_2305806 [Thermothelomyces thermophilus ATCC 42464]AEO58457.1 hypothetical protein MYCTH_2305806 [Thermothelomyces thermophilus ATCC 42464]